jgi:cytochrome P450
MKVESIRGQLLTMYVAGFHTTSVALAWLLFAVASHADVQRRLREEIFQACGNDTPSLEHLDDLKYCQMVVRETLRLYPAAWELFARQSIEESEISGYRVPAKSLILILPYVTHRDPRFFPEPEKFDPLRFSPEREHEIPAFAYLPFGHGPRHCIGKSLALSQMRLVLASVLQKFELEIDKNGVQQIQLVPRVSLRPKGDIRLMLKNSRAMPKSNPDSVSG